MDSKDISITFFLRRLQQLQSLCSSTNVDLPNALLFVAGADGRHNKGSITVLKYLFTGSVGKDLTDSFMDSTYDSLDEVVLLVQELSLSIFCSSEAKAIIGHLLSACPIVVEYVTTPDEEKEVDLFEAKKCISFKRMILEAVPEGSAIGVPVPMGYDEVQDTESWPMLQAFALEEVLCATGFFTARYAIVDISETLETIFRTVDGFYVANALSVLARNVLPHADQTIGQFETRSAEQRSLITADSALAPLELLYDFGALEAAHPADPELRPTLLIGPLSRFVGTPPSSLPRGWREAVVGDAVHVVVEGCEPSTGLRWCRTLFLMHGRELSSPILDTALVAGAGAATGADSRGRFHVRCRVVDRLRNLYSALWTSLRRAVVMAFGACGDVLEAGAMVQRLLELWTGRGQGGGGEEGTSLPPVAAPSPSLMPGERLQLHMDCMDGHGRVVSVHDVDDMGGRCWMYLRVSVHGIDADVHIAGEDALSVSVGDTFVYTPGYRLLGDTLLLSRASDASEDTFPSTTPLPGLLSDAYCITHSVPYLTRCVGAGVEEAAATRLTTIMRNPHTRDTSDRIRPMGGETLSEDLTLPLLSDVPQLPYAVADLTLHTDGLVIRRLDRVTCLPIAVDMGLHVEAVWTVDAAICNERAAALMEAGWTSSHVVPEGLFLVMRMKAYVDEEKETDDGDDGDGEGGGGGRPSVSRKVSNPLSAVLDASCVSTPSRILALFVASGGRESSAMSRVLSCWRRVFRANDVPEYRGKEDSLPDEFVRSFVCAVDVWGRRGGEEEGVGSGGGGGGGGDSLEMFRQVSGRCIAAGTGSSILTNTFGVAEVLLKGNGAVDDEAVAQLVDLTSALDGKRAGDGGGGKCVVVLGVPGGGALTMSHLLATRLREEGSQSPVQRILLDLSVTDDIEATLESLVTSRTWGLAKAGCVVVCVLLSPRQLTPPGDVLGVLRGMGADTRLVLFVGTAPRSVSGYAGNGLGSELWSAAEAACAGVCHMALLAGSSSAFASIRERLEATNPSLSCSRLDTDNFRVDDYLLQTAVDRLRSVSTLDDVDVDRFTRRCFRRPRGELSMRRSESPTLPSLPSLRCVEVSLDGGDASWDLTLLHTCLREVFPSASVGSVLLEESWPVPPNHDGTTGLRRAQQLAKVKVLFRRQAEMGLARLRTSLQSVPADTMTTLRGGALRLAVHGVVIGGGRTRALVEASAGLVLVKKLSVSDGGDSQMGPGAGSLLVHGTFDDDLERVIRGLLLDCRRFRLTSRPLLTRDDVSVKQRLLLQNSCLTAPLSSGWFFDGQDFIDCNGNRRPLRPDIDNIVDDYLAAANASVRVYNEILDDVIEFI